eukprot:759574-Hanusia_phi.AAC.1
MWVIQSIFNCLQLGWMPPGCASTPHLRGSEAQASQQLKISSGRGRWDHNDHRMEPLGLGYGRVTGAMTPEGSCVAPSSPSLPGEGRGSRRVFVSRYLLHAEKNMLSSPLVVSSMAVGSAKRQLLRPENLKYRATLKNRELHYFPFE